MAFSLAEHLLNHRQAIDDYFADCTRGKVPSLYLSCDIRHSGHKAGVVDTNLFPAGFNNLCNAYRRATLQALRRYFGQYLPTVKKVLLLVEEHTRNRFYLENVHQLLTLLQHAGLEARPAYLGAAIDSDSFEVDLGEERVLKLEKLVVKNGLPAVSDFVADWIVSNNDFSSGVPEILTGLADKICPSPALGWHRRKKSRHFQLLQEEVQRFAPLVGLDPWRLAPLFDVSSESDLSQESAQAALAQKVDALLEKIRGHYSHYGIEDPPYVFVKNDAGTYGMGLIEVMQSDEILQMNRRTRNKLLSAKGGQKSLSFLLQEGIPTADFYSDFPIEPVIYMIGFEVVGGFFRMNALKDAYASLNSKGMDFSCLCLHKLDEPHEKKFLNCAEKGDLVYLASVLARLAALAAAREVEAEGV